MPSNDRTGGHGLGPEDFESIRDAVMETPRGRWFLTEFANRLRASETAGLLDGMNRIEKAVTANHDALMARLAEALKEQPSPAPAAQPSAALAQRHMKYFRQDEEIFEPAPPARIAAVADAPKPEPEAPRGATVVIRRGTAEERAPAPETPQPATAAAPPPVQAEPETLPRRRIVIIRHKPGEDIDVPLQNEMAHTG